MNARGLAICAALMLASATLGFGAPPPAPATTGVLRLTFTEHSPLSGAATVLQRLGMADHPPQNLAGMAYEMSFVVYVPPNYRSDSPHGLLVWMGVSEFSSAWLNTLSRHHLILICANNVQGRPARYGAALDAAHNMRRLYNIDPNRVYVSGFSAGGQLATHMVRCFPEVFRGGLFLLGGNFYLSHELGGGRREPTVEPAHPLWQGNLDQVKKTVKLVIMKGGADSQWWPAEGRADYLALWLDGFIHVTYLEVPGLSHVPPGADWFEYGIAALEQSKPLTPPAISPTSEPNPQPGQIAQAQRILATAEYNLELRPSPGISKPVAAKMLKSQQDKARRYLQRTLDEYLTTPAAAKARKLLAALEPPAK